MYNGKSKRFTGTNITDDSYGSIELPFGQFYKAQIEPLKEIKYGVSPFGGPNVNTTLFKFIDGGPYYIDNYYDELEPDPLRLRFFFKYNNADNPHSQITLRPVTLMGGFYQVGGIITMCGLVNVLLYLYNKRSVEGMLLREWKERVVGKINYERNQIPDEKQKVQTAEEKKLSEYKKHVGKLFFGKYEDGGDELTTTVLDKMNKSSVI